jgi:hypothetical protein
MKTNMGRTDRIIRIIAGLIIALAGIFLNSWWGLIGIVLLATGFISFCPLYAVFGFSTCKESSI